MSKEISISFDAERCIHCGRCVEECPSEIISWEKGELPNVSSSESCIECGHCVAVCPQEAVLHSDFPKEKVFAYQRESLPSPESLMQLMKARRSIRNFQEKEIPSEFLAQIIEAGRTAPTAENSLSVRTLLITDTEKIRSVAQFTLKTFEKVMKFLLFPPVKFLLKPFMKKLYKREEEMTTMIKDFAEGKDDVLHHCKAFLIFYTSKSNRFGKEDCNLAYQNASLMAETLGVGHFYTGFVMLANQYAFSQNLEKMFSIDGKVCAGMALGMPKYIYPHYAEKPLMRTK